MKADHILDYLQSVIGVQYDRFVASDEPMKPSPGRTEMEHNGRKVECVIAKVYDKGNEDFTLKRVYFSS